jgi:O-6-methylguanine DNA methyltransferase
VKKIEGVWFAVALDEESEKIYATNFGRNEKTVLQGLEKSLPKHMQRRKLEKTRAIAERMFTSLMNIYEGKEASDSFNLAAEHLSPYTQKVIRVTSLIPLGYATSYATVAKTAGGSPRAVGRVMAFNPFPPIVPCHRVVSSNLGLVGYGGGLDAKHALLERERKGYTRDEEISVDGKKLKVFPVEFVLRKLSKGKR